MSAVSQDHYLIVVEGELGPRYASAFEGMELRAADGFTVIDGPVEDQAKLVGLLNSVTALGLTLVSVQPVDGSDG